METIISIKLVFTYIKMAKKNIHKSKDQRFTRLIRKDYSKLKTNNKLLLHCDTLYKYKKNIFICLTELESE